MNHTLVDTENGKKVTAGNDKGRAALIKDVRKSIELALDESGWSGKKDKASLRIAVVKNKKFEGEAGIRWTADLALVECRSAKSPEKDPYAIIFCLDLSSIKSQVEVRNSLNEIGIRLYDLCYFAGTLKLLIVKDDKKAGEKDRVLIPSDYGRLFAGVSVRVMEWTSANALDIAVKLLHKIKRLHFASKNSSKKSIDETMAILVSKHPQLFELGYKRRHILQDTRCVELLNHIKVQDPIFSFGEIIQAAMLQSVSCKSLIGAYLEEVDDKKFEKLLKKYLARQKQI